MAAQRRPWGRRAAPSAAGLTPRERRRAVGGLLFGMRTSGRKDITDEPSGAGEGGRGHQSGGDENGALSARGRVDGGRQERDLHGDQAQQAGKRHPRAHAVTPTAHSSSPRRSRATTG